MQMVRLGRPAQEANMAKTVDLIGNQTYSDTALTDYIVTNTNGVGSNTLTLGDGTDTLPSAAVAKTRSPSATAPIRSSPAAPATP
jgi:hypothetical protein